jgi:hypothetical protein
MKKFVAFTLVCSFFLFTLSGCSAIAQAQTTTTPSPHTTPVPKPPMKLLQPAFDMVSSSEDGGCSYTTTMVNMEEMHVTNTSTKEKCSVSGMLDVLIKSRSEICGFVGDVKYAKLEESLRNWVNDHEKTGENDLHFTLLQLP